MDPRTHIPARKLTVVSASAPHEERGPVVSDVPSPPEDGDASQRQWVVWLAVGGGLAVVLLVARADVDQLLRTAAGIAPTLLALPALATLGSYLTMAWSYQGIARAAGYRLPFREMCSITLVANTANYLLATGGLSGFALRMYLFARRGIPAGSAVLISLVQTLLTNLVLLVFVMWGFALLLLSHNLVGRDLIAAGTLLIAFGIVVVVTCVALLHRRWRRTLLFSATRLLDRLLRRFAPHRRPRRAKLVRFQHNLNVGLDFLLQRPHDMLAPTAYIVLDWIFTLLVLYTSFVAIGSPIAMSHVIAGFAIGMFFSVASLIPGGLGIMEGSMAAVFVTLGVQFEQAVVAILIYRAAYYGLPILASVLIAPRVLRA
ncbi:MAG: flippase-like domain-containing protein [Deltaproteobacteria bacterium]|nr:flippase-like domain-containing protein [Deltaproteobacteria bacterium]